MVVPRGSYRNSEETVYNNCDDYIISEFIWQPLVYFYNHLIFSFINKSNAFLISKFFQDIAILKFLGTSNARCTKTILEIKSFPQEDFGYIILQKMLSNDPKISFLWIFSGLIPFWVKSTRLDNIFISTMNIVQIM